MYRKLARIVAVVAIVLGTFGVSYAAWDGTSMARPSAPVAGISTTPLGPRPARATALRHPAIGSVPTELVARRMITPHVTLQTVQVIHN